MKRLMAFIIGLMGPAASRSGASPRLPEAGQVAPDCAIWNDINRALDAKPKGLSK